MTGFDNPERSERIKKQTFEMRVNRALAAWGLADEAIFDTVIPIIGGEDEAVAERAAATRREPTVVMEVRRSAAVKGDIMVETVEGLAARSRLFAQAQANLGPWQATLVEDGVLVARETEVDRHGSPYRLVHEQLIDQDQRMLEERLVLVPSEQEAPAAA